MAGVVLPLDQVGRLLWTCASSCGRADRFLACVRGLFPATCSACPKVPAHGSPNERGNALTFLSRSEQHIALEFRIQPYGIHRRRRRPHGGTAGPALQQFLDVVAAANTADADADADALLALRRGRGPSVLMLRSSDRRTPDQQAELIPATPAHLRKRTVAMELSPV